MKHRVKYKLASQNFNDGMKLVEGQSHERVCDLVGEQLHEELRWFVFEQIYEPVRDWVNFYVRDGVCDETN